MAIILAITVLNVGCSKIVTVSPGEVRKTSKTKNIVEVVPKSKIAGYSTGRYDIRYFDSTGGKYDASSNTIKGVDANGKSIVVEIRDVQNVILADGRPTIIFDGEKGRIDNRRQMIVGTTKDYMQIEIPLKDVSFYRVKKIDYLLTSIAIGLPIIVTGGIIMSISFEDWIDSGW
jgi:hypothetical protein